jgi:haloalkane dehalogenase
MHDFGGPVGIGFAARHPDLIRRVISTNGPTPFGQTDLVERLKANVDASPWFQWIVKAEREGSLETVLGQLGFNILSTLKLNGFENNAIITDRWLSAYGSHFASPTDCLGAIGWAKGLATGAHRFETPDAAADRAIRSKPALAIWGAEDRTLRAAQFLPLFAALFPKAPIHRLAGVGHYCLEDAPNEVAALIAGFIQRT